VLASLTACHSASAPAPAGTVVALTHSGARNGQAAWSSSGRMVAFVSNRERGWQIWTMAADGSEQSRVTEAVAPVGWPTWSDDDRALIYYEGGDDGYRLMRVQRDSGQAAPLDGGPDYNAFRPSPSPDGRALLFDAVDPSVGNHDIYLQDRATGTITRLTENAGYDSDARWSPDGQWIVFHSDRGASGLQTQVFVMPSRGGEVRQLTIGPDVNGYPAWSPSGACIVYTSERGADRDVWLMDASGGRKRRLTTYSGFDGDPVWHPLGHAILFSTDRFGGQELAMLTLGEEDVSHCG
jgi:TolB protein